MTEAFVVVGPVGIEPPHCSVAADTVKSAGNATAMARQWGPTQDLAPTDAKQKWDHRSDPIFLW